MQQSACVVLSLVNLPIVVEQSIVHKFRTKLIIGNACLLSSCGIKHVPCCGNVGRPLGLTGAFHVPLARNIVGTVARKE